jgi:RNA-directed DNA polymerase
MTNDHGKSDRSVVPEKQPNKGDAQAPPAEAAEGRDLTEGKWQKQNACRTQSRDSAPSALDAIRQTARADKKMRFTALLHHVYNIDALGRAFYSLKRNAAPGVDAVTWQHYEENLGERLQDLSNRVREGAYRAKPVKRVYIPKPDGHQRPLGIPALEDKIVQKAMVEVLNSIYETDFLGFSYGFRPGRSAHNALDALYVGFMKRKVNWVLDADIRDFFNAIDHGWLIRFIEHRIADKRIVRLIQKWLRAGVLEDGMRTLSEAGTPQGGIISPLLANIYLHYVFDLWTQQWRKRQAQSDIIVVRYADDFIVGFHYWQDAQQYQDDLKARLAKFNLELHPEKTRLIEFGRFVITARKRRGRGKPETFNFLGFKHICGVRKDGIFTVLRQTVKKRMQAKLKEVKAELRRRMHLPIKDVGRWLRSVLVGHFNYYGVPTNGKQLDSFRNQVIRHWRHTLNRRSQRTRMTWQRMYQLVETYLPPAKITHEYPLERFARAHPK